MRKANFSAHRKNKETDRKASLTDANILIMTDFATTCVATGQTKKV